MINHKTLDSFIALRTSVFISEFVFGIHQRRKGSVQKEQNARKNHFNMFKSPSDFNEIDKRIDQYVSSTDNVSSLSLDKMSADLQMPRKTLGTYFTHHLDTDFRTWKANIKVDKAKALLISNEEMRIEEIASSSGFLNKSNLYRQFKTVTGFTPAQWRQCKGNPDLL